MESFDPRLVEVSIQIGDSIQTFGDGFYITAQGTKYGNANPNVCQVRIENLTREHRNQILTETSPWIAHGRADTLRKIIVRAGRVSYGASTLFEGNISYVDVTQPPDIGIILNAVQGLDASLKTVAVSMPGTTSLKTISQTAANSIGVNLDFQANDKQIANYSFTGSMREQINKIQATGNVDVFFGQSGQTLVVTDKNVPVVGRVKKLSMNSGMIGIPERTELGIRVKILLDNETDIGGQIDLVSQLNPGMNGSYVVQKLGFDISSRDVPFYWIAEGQALIS